jgi:hypothetical protein
MISIDSIKRDFIPFIDPATGVDVTPGDRTARIKFTRNGEDHDYIIDLHDGRIDARRPQARVYVSIASVLASSAFADLRTMTDTQQRMHREFDPQSFIPLAGEVDGQDFDLDYLRSKMAPTKSRAESLKIILLDGPAGVGKTSLIKILLVERARNYGRTETVPPILHIASRGRRLSGLNEALAQSIQLIRAKFTFDQVPVLVRQGLIQVAIDGFDELVDPDGYQDAWYALRDFFSDTGVGGPIILAGRDTFFNQQNFNNRLLGLQHKADLSHVRLAPVSSSAARRWLAAQGWPESELSSQETNEILADGKYTLRPFFLSVLSPLKGWSRLRETATSDRGFLVEEFLFREGNLVAENILHNLDKDKSVDIAKKRLTSIFSEVALEMADTETESVDLAFLQLATEVAFSDVAENEDIRKLQHKAGSFALLENDPPRDDYRRFPHSEISNHFLALALIEKIADGVCPRVIRRGVISTDFLSVFQEIFEGTDAETAIKFIDSTQRLLSMEKSFDRMGENLSAILVATIGKQINDSEARIIADATITEAAFFGVAYKTRMNNVQMSRFDVREADLTLVRFDECKVGTLIIDGTTKFGMSLPYIYSLQTVRGGNVETIYDPGDIKKALGVVPAQSHVDEQSENHGAVCLLERVCRKMLRQYYIRDDREDPAGSFLRDPWWDSVRKILERHKRIKIDTSKPVSGPQSEFVHIIDARSLLGRDAGVAEIWREVSSIPMD